MCATRKSCWKRKGAFVIWSCAYSATHLDRLSDNTVQSIETSSLHIDLISDLKRINSLLCSVAYPIWNPLGPWHPAACVSLWSTVKALSAQRLPAMRCHQKSR